MGTAKLDSLSVYTKRIEGVSSILGHFVKGFLAIFRAYYGQYVGDEWYNRFLAEMTELHPEF